MKILVLLSRVPYPLDKGDKLRAFNQIRRLSEKNEVLVFALNDNPKLSINQRELNNIANHWEIFSLDFFSIGLNLIIALFKGLPFQVGYFFSTRAKKKIHKTIISFKPDLIYCQLLRTAEYVKDIHEIPKALDYMDVFSKGIERRMNNFNFLKRTFFRSEFKRLEKYEKDIFGYFDLKTIISEQDRNHLPHPFNKEIKVISNGVDTKYFFPFETKKEFDVLFSGNMNYPPNIDAAVFLVKKVMPLVRNVFPKVSVQIAGTDPGKEVLALASPLVLITGWVKDIRVCYANSRVFAAPMNIGTGMQNKLLEAMAMGIPCITTPLANNALNGIHDNHLLIGTTAEEIATHIINLLKNKDLADRISGNGKKYVRENYSWSNSTILLEHLFTNITSNK